MRLDAAFAVAPRGVDVALEVQAGHTLALVGGNGAGKTTVLETLAGVVSPTSGSATLGDRVLFSRGGTRTVDTEPRLRRVAIVSQDSALFPHMSVADNVAFPARARGENRSQAHADAAGWLERVGASHLATRRPSSLSGGEARRVAIARALAARPDLLLLDEPFSSLDVESATAIRALVREVLEGVTAMVSTHSGLDGAQLASRVAVLSRGRVVEEGATSDVFTRPRTQFAAAMAGRIMIEGTVEAEGLRTDAGVMIPARGLSTRGTRSAIAVPPSRIGVATLGDARAPGLVWFDVPITSIEARDEVVRIRSGQVYADVDALAGAHMVVGDVVGFGVPFGEPAYPL